MRPSLQQFTGCLSGHALGDALGAPVEFRSRSEILRLYGPDGVRGLEPVAGRPAGTYTDDTQMMRATAEGLVEYLEAWHAEGAFADLSQAVWPRYVTWCETQSDPGQARSPGETCMSAVQDGIPGDTFDPINDSKGSGGIMRVSPVGLVFEPHAAFEHAVDTAALTHGHPTGYLAAGVFAELVSRVSRGQPLDESVREAREVLVGWGEEAEETLAAIDLAVELYIADVHPIEALPQIGQGWVADEALAIAVHCALSYPEDWVEGTLAAVNITGDSDTTGCLAGALLGARLGEHALPASWLGKLEDGRGIMDLARRLWDAVAGQ